MSEPVVPASEGDSGENPPAETHRPKGPRLGSPEQFLKDDVEAFFHALNKTPDDTDSHVYIHGSAQPYVRGARQGFFGVSEWEKWWLGFRDTQLLLVALKLEALEGNYANVTLKYKSGHEIEEKFTLSWGSSTWESAERWQFLPEVPDEREMLKYAPLRWAVYLLAQPPGALQDFQAQLSREKIGHLGFAALMSLMDDNERFAFDAESVEGALQQYLGQVSRAPQPWIIPTTTQRYHFNTWLANVAREEVREPERTILFYEGRDEKPLFHYNGKAVISTVDGHILIVDVQQFKTLKWEPGAPLHFEPKREGSVEIESSPLSQSNWVAELAENVVRMEIMTSPARFDAKPGKRYPIGLNSAQIPRVMNLLANVEAPAAPLEMAGETGELKFWVYLYLRDRQVAWLLLSPPNGQDNLARYRPPDESSYLRENTEESKEPFQAMVSAKVSAASYRTFVQIFTSQKLEDSPSFCEMEYAMPVPAEIDEVEVIPLPPRYRLATEEAVLPPAARIKGAVAQEIAGLWRSLPFGSEMKCHEPPFRFCFFREGQLLLSASVCWQCNNVYATGGGQQYRYAFDGKHPLAQQLLALAKRAVERDG